MKSKIYFLIFAILIFFIPTKNFAIENKILFKINNQIITTLDIFNELKYLESINEQFKNTENKNALEIARRSLIKEKIKEIELRKKFIKIKIEDKFLSKLLVNYFRKNQIKTISDFENYYKSLNINPDLIRKKIAIEVIWNQMIFDRYNQFIKIDKENIRNDLKKNTKQKEFLLSEILINLNEGEKLQEKFELIKEKIKETSFNETALMYSISDTANKGGQLGWVKETAISKKIKNKLKNIKIGNYTDLITIPGGFLILKIENARELDDIDNLDNEVEKIIIKKTNEQLNQFSNILLNKIQKDIFINEL